MDEFVNPVPEDGWTNGSQEPKPARTYTPVACVAAWMCMLAGYLFCRAFPVRESPLGGFLVVMLLFAATTVLLKLQGAKFGFLPVTVAVSGVVIAWGLVLSSNTMIRFLSYVYALGAYGYYVYGVTGNVIKKGFTDLLAVDFLKALFVMPFSSMGHFFKAMFSGKAKGGGKFLAKVFVGICLTIIPTLVVLVLLSYDRGFMDLLEKILDFGDGDVFSHIGSLILGIPVGMYLFGLFLSAVDNKHRQTLTEQGCKNTAERLKLAPVVTVLTAVLPLLFLYVVFFISQWSYYISGFTGVLPENFSYAEYAREGFFQLCIVTVINLLVLTAIGVFMKRKNRISAVLMKLLALTFSVFTLILIATALAKLFMYIDYYGLTPKRVYAAWFMGVLAIVFLLIGVKQFVSRLPVVAAGISVFVLMFAVLAVPNTDAAIAKYNVDRYLAGTLETVDMLAMEELGLSGVPEVVRLEKALREKGSDLLLHTKTKEYFRRVQNRLFYEEQPELFSYSVPYLRAKKAMDTLPDDLKAPVK